MVKTKKIKTTTIITILITIIVGLFVIKSIYTTNFKNHNRTFQTFIANAALNAYHKHNITDPKKLGKYVLDNTNISNLPENTELNIIVVPENSAVQLLKPGINRYRYSGLQDTRWTKSGGNLHKWVGDFENFAGWMNINRNNFNNGKIKYITAHKNVHNEANITIPSIYSLEKNSNNSNKFMKKFYSFLNYTFSNESLQSILSNSSSIKNIYLNYTNKKIPLNINNHKAYIVTKNTLYFIISDTLEDSITSNGESDTDILFLEYDNSDIFNIWNNKSWSSILKWRHSAIVK